MPSTHSKPASEAAAVEQLLRQDGFVDELFDPVKEEEADNEDFRQFVQVRQGRNISDLFDADFLAFCRWLRHLVHKDLGFTLDDFRALNRREVLKDLGLMAATALAIVGLHVSLPAWTEWLWGPVLFMQCVLVFRRQTFLHARMHYVANMTGWPVLDWAVDGLLMLLLGMSKDAFYRRHIDEHLSHISNMARVFGEDWKPFDDLPAVWWLKPWLMVQLLLDKERMAQERFSYRQLAWECLVLHCFLGLVAWELVVNGSHLLLVYHVAAAAFTMGASLMTGMLTHSGVDARNSFNSCGLFDVTKATGLFKVSVGLIEWASNYGLSAHAIHHAYSQCPVPILLPKIKEINEHVLKTYPNTRLNRVLSHEVYRDLYARLPPPQWYDYIVQLLVSLACLGLATLVILGLPYPPIVLECAFVDYRVMLVSTRAERYACAINYWDSVNLLARATQMKTPNGYLNYVVRNYHFMRDHLLAQPPVAAVPRRLYAPRSVYEHNVGQVYVDAWLHEQ